MKLRSNTEFGKLCKSKEKEFKTRLEYLTWYEATRNKIDAFLDQPLQLWMVVPCDDNGVPIEEPICYGVGDEQYYGCRMDEYQQAKEKCLFEGCALRYYNVENSGCTKVDFNGKNIALFQDDYSCNKIEDLVNHNLTLTPTAIKQLGFDIFSKKTIVVGTMGVGKTHTFINLLHKEANVVVVDDIASMKKVEPFFPELKQIELKNYTDSPFKKNRKQNNSKKKKRK